MNVYTLLVYLKFLAVLQWAASADAIQCWKCIDHDCDMDPEQNYKAHKVTCETAKSSCMKVRYKMSENVTVYDSVIRTCSDGPCMPITEDEFENCIRNKNRYWVSGCSLRCCCSDRDMCNGEIHIISSAVITSILTVVCVIHYFICM